MTPKEKAREIVSKYRGTFFRNMSDGDAKRCALIAVNEMLFMLAYTENYVNDEMGRIGAYLIYWQEVKQEIEKL
jgi:hypothetical protein